MTATPAILIQTKYLENADTQQYVAGSAVKAVKVDEFTVANRSGAAATLLVRVVPNGATPGVEHELFPSKSLNAGEVYQLPPFTLGPGDTVRTTAGAATALVARAAGRVIT